MMKYLQKRHRNTVLFASLCLLAALASCKEGDAVFSDIDNPTYDFLADRTVPVDISMNIATAKESAVRTRLSNFVTQVENPNTRVVTDFHLIPYGVKREIEATDVPYDRLIGELSPVGEMDSYNNFYGRIYQVPLGTASFLCYCSGVPVSGGKEANGSIIKSDLDNPSVTSDIYFAPELIYVSNSDHAKATTIASYLTTIANATGWATSESQNWKDLFDGFTNNGELMPGSSTNVKTFIRELKNSVDQQEDGALKTAVLTAIDIDNLNDNVPDGFPGDIGLPDGGAVVVWDRDNSRFNVQRQATTMANMLSHDRYVYPPELYFYGNSQIYTSNSFIPFSAYIGKTWPQVLNLYTFQNNATVLTATRGVAIEEPLRYAVGCLKATVKASAGTLLDADDKPITVGSTTFPLTGILVSGQYKQNFDFTPQASELTEYALYDRSFSGVYMINTSTPTVFSTLSFQSKEDVRPVRFALEFRNDGEQVFRGNNGLIYPGTKFYLVGSIYPKENPDPTKDYEKRVFTKSYITELTMTVSSLADAYNVVPDLLSGRLEVGVQLVTDWIEVTTTDVVLK